MELSGLKTPPGPSLCLKIVVAAVCGKANDPLTPLKRLQRNYLVMGIVRENVPSSIPFFSPFLTQNLTQNRKNWGGAESTQPPGFGLFQVTKPPENVEPQQMQHSRAGFKVFFQVVDFQQGTTHRTPPILSSISPCVRFPSPLSGAASPGSAVCSGGIWVQRGTLLPVRWGQASALQ